MCLGADNPLTQSRRNRLLPQIIATVVVSWLSIISGYASAYSSPSERSLQHDLDLSSNQISWIGGLLPVGALVGGLSGGFVIEYIGRRYTLLVADVIFAIGWTINFFANHAYYMYVSRLLCGYSVGIVSFAVPVYIAETVQAKIRGRLGLIPTAFGNFGILLCYAAGTGLEWKWLAGVAAILTLPFLVTVWLIPDTYRWYMSKKKYDQANWALRWFRGRGFNVEGEMAKITTKKLGAKNSKVKQTRNDSKTDINVSKERDVVINDSKEPKNDRRISKDETDIDESKDIGSKPQNNSKHDLIDSKRLLDSESNDVISKDPDDSVKRLMPTIDSAVNVIKLSKKQRLKRQKEKIFTHVHVKALLIVLGLMFFQQLGGINAVIFYVTEIFEMSEKPLIPPEDATTVIGVVNFISTLVATALVDRQGRKPLMIASCLSMIVSLFALSWYFYVMIELKSAMTHLEWVPLASLVVYVAGFSVGMGPVPWLMVGEMLPAYVRGPAASVCAAFNWTCTFMVTKLFPVAVKEWGAYIVFSVFGGVTLAAVVFVWLVVPETKKKSLEEIEELLGGGKVNDDAS